MSVPRGRPAKGQGPVTKEQDELERKKRAFQVALGERLQSLRLKRGLAQEPLAELASLHRTHIHMLEKAKIDPSAHTLFKVAAALGVTLSELLDFEVTE